MKVNTSGSITSKYLECVPQMLGKSLTSIEKERRTNYRNSVGCDLGCQRHQVYFHTPSGVHSRHVQDPHSKTKKVWSVNFSSVWWGRGLDHSLGIKPANELVRNIGVSSSASNSGSLVFVFGDSGKEAFLRRGQNWNRSVTKEGEIYPRFRFDSPFPANAGEWRFYSAVEKKLSFMQCERGWILFSLPVQVWYFEMGCIDSLVKTI